MTRTDLLLAHISIQSGQICDSVFTACQMSNVISATVKLLTAINNDRKRYITLKIKIVYLLCLFTFLFRSAKSKPNQNTRHTLHAGLIMASGPHWGMPLEHAISTNMMVAPPFEKQPTPIWSMVVAFCHAANTNTLVSLLTGNRP